LSGGAGGNLGGGAGVGNNYTTTISGTSKTYSAGGGTGVANTGNGGFGEGSNHSSPPRSGGTGELVIAYPSTYSAAATVTGTYTVSTSARSGYYVYTFTSGSGSIRW
jgi:hypothetical protein